MAIQVKINVRNLQLDERLQDYVTKKVRKLDRYLDTLEEAKVDLTHVKTARNASDRQIAQLTVRGKSVLLRAEERSADMYVSVDAVLSKIHRQIERYKGKRWHARGDGRTAAEAGPDQPESETVSDFDTDQITRRKKHLLTPMDEREAIEQMALLGQDNFFVFLDASTNQVHVLYRRRDGKLGLIIPEIA